MRKKKHGSERILACGDLFVENPQSITSDKPVHLEIGCGKGAFITECARRNPDVQFYAMERISDVILLAAEKTKENEIGNIRFIIGDAKNVAEYFAPHSVERIYLNFSDPWPKKGHAKRRLTHKNFLDVYKEILVPGGSIFVKTDNRPLFDFSLESLAENGFELRNVTYDLHNSEFNADNIVTEYEKTFSEKGFTINRVEAYLL